MFNTNSHRFAGLLVALILLATVVMPISVRAAGPWYVATTGDDNASCLSPATACATINGVLAKPGFVAGDTIRVAIGTYTGTGTEVVLLDKNATLSGGWNDTFSAQNGMSTIDGQGVRKGIDVSISTAIVERFLVQHGFGLPHGGGIRNNFGELTLNDSIVSDNAADWMGGGVFNFGTLTINNTVISGNSAGNACCGGGGGGGGIMNYSGTVVVNNSTVSGNAIIGGFSGSGIDNFDTFILNNSTVSGNTGAAAIEVGAGVATLMTLNNSTVSGNIQGGIYKTHGNLVLNNSTISDNAFGIRTELGYFGTATVQNSILAGNIADCFGTVSSLGHSLIGNASNCNFMAGTGDLVNVAAQLGPLQNNGGQTFTHALLPDSPAIDAGNPAGCTDQTGNPLSTDQRGVARPQGPRCDIGAFELEPAGTSVSIDIVPGNATNIINLRSTSVPVAILSSNGFNAFTDVNRASLRFGKTGNEASLISCAKSGQDVNRDGRLDLICSFRISLTGLMPGDTVAKLKGSTVAGIAFEGSDLVKVMSGVK